MNGVSKTRTARGAALAAVAALCLGIGTAHATFVANNGKLAFVNGGSIYTVNPDGTSLSAALHAGANPAFSPDGSKIAFDDGVNLWTMLPDGSSAALVPGPIAGTHPAWIDSSTVAFATTGANTQVNKVTVGGAVTLLSQSGASNNQDPAVSPDGSKIAFASNRTGQFEIWVMNASDGSGQAQISGGGISTNTNPTWSPGATRVAFVSNRDGNQEIYSTSATPPAGGDFRLTTTAVNNTGPAYSPDGTLIAFSSAGFLATMPAGGGSPTAVTGPLTGSDPDWQDAPPSNLSAPGITPTTPPFVGGTLFASVGTWSGAPTIFAYQWLRCDGAGLNCVSIGGAIASSYVVQAADVGAAVRLRIQVTATNIAGSTAAQSLTAGTAVGPAPTNVTKPVISGQPKAFPGGTSVSATSGTWTGTTPITFTFQWQYCDYLMPPQCGDISGATSSSYSPTGDYIGKRLQVIVTATNVSGSGTATSLFSFPVTGEQPRNTVSPKIVGVIEVGSTLVSDIGTWTGSTPLHNTYEWLRCGAQGTNCVVIAGATTQSYVLQPGDYGSTIVFKVIVTNGAGAGVGQSIPTSPIRHRTLFGPANTSPPTLDGKPVTGSTLVADPGSWTGEPPLTYTYTWLRCDASGGACTGVPNAAGKLYKLRLADAGSTIKFLVTTRNAVGVGSASSDPTGVVTKRPPQPRGRKIVGTKNNDYLAGKGGNDTILGLGGNDTILGGGGDDVLRGGVGKDVITGGPGADRIFGEQGSDTIFAADGERDVIDCGPGVDRVIVDKIDVVKNCELTTIKDASNP